MIYMSDMIKENVILCDCKEDEVEELKRGLEESTNESFLIKSNVANNFNRKSKFGEFKRYFRYFSTPFSIFIHRKKYKTILGWQQFYALIYCFFCSIFHVKKRNYVMAINFTYKEKSGFKGKIYHKFMKTCLENKYLDQIHVLSFSYKSRLLDTFNIPENKIIVSPFGIPDSYNIFKDSKVNEQNYALSIGRSNRDYEYLIKEWKKVNKYNLLIITDSKIEIQSLPKNVKVITSYDQFPYINNASFIIIPLKDTNLCSGDTVLLNSMSLKKLVIVSDPSTLKEMYIKNGFNGVAVSKNEDCLANYVNSLNEDEIYRIGENARKDFLENYSRYSMGKHLGREYLNYKNTKAND